MNIEAPKTVLTDATVRRIAFLARLAMSDSDVSKAKEDLSTIFSHIDSLLSLDTKHVEPLDHPTELLNHVRDDDPTGTLSQEQVLMNAPSVKDVYFDVPKVLKEQT